MTAKTLEKLPVNIRKEIERFKLDYKTTSEKIDGLTLEYRCIIQGYLMGLKDADIITEQERKALFCYITL